MIKTLTLAFLVLLASGCSGTDSEVSRLKHENRLMQLELIYLRLSVKHERKQAEEAEKKIFSVLPKLPNFPMRSLKPSEKKTLFWDTHDPVKKGPI